MLVHLTARTRAGQPLLADQEVAAMLWSGLRRGFPAALAVVLMPNHLHLIGDEPSPSEARFRLGRILGAITRRVRTKGRRDFAGWQPVPEPARIPDVMHLRRQVRYVALNPCRAGLTRDPLEWPWSTYRDVMGAIADPWVDGARLASAFGTSRRDFGTRFHAYVSGDPSCSVTGTAPPRPARPSPAPAYSLERILVAAASATRAPVSAVTSRSRTRLLFVLLATRHGWHDTRLLAGMCRTSRQSVAKLRRKRAEALIAAGELCLGDERLYQSREDGGTRPAAASPRRRIA